MAEDDIFCHNGHQLPMLFLLGAQKCGSTSLVYELWDQYGFAHGLPYRGRFNDGCDSYNDNKEKHFFEDDCRYAKGIDGYDLAARRRRRRDGSDASPPRRRRARASGASGRAAKASPRRAAPSRQPRPRAQVRAGGAGV